MVTPARWAAGGPRVRCPAAAQCFDQRDRGAEAQLVVLDLGPLIGQGGALGIDDLEIAGEPALVTRTRDRRGRGRRRHRLTQIAPPAVQIGGVRKRVLGFAERRQHAAAIRCQRLTVAGLRGFEIGAVAAAVE
jgi:hypothetical protein